MPKPLTLPAKLDRFPPAIVRLLARRTTGHQVVALTDAEVARAAGLTVSEVRSLSKLRSWDDVPVATMMSFIKGCGADLDNRDWLRKNAAYMENIRGVPRYLRKSPDWETTFQPLVGLLARSAA